MQTHPLCRRVRPEAAKAIHESIEGEHPRRPSAIVRAILKRWHKLLRFLGLKRKAKKSVINRTKREKLREAHGDFCFWCGGIMVFDDKTHKLYATIEHLLPVSQGGTNEKKNLRLAHWACNNARHGKMFHSIKQQTLKESQRYAKKITAQKNWDAQKIREVKARVKETGEA